MQACFESRLVWFCLITSTKNFLDFTKTGSLIRCTQSRASAHWETRYICTRTLARTHTLARARQSHAHWNARLTHGSRNTIHSQCTFLLKLTHKCNYKKCNWFSGSPSILYKLVLLAASMLANKPLLMSESTDWYRWAGTRTLHCWLAVLWSLQWWIVWLIGLA